MVDNTRPAVVAPGAKRSKRIPDIDATRGLALIGMISIHVLPMATGTGEPTSAWQLAAGLSAARTADRARSGYLEHADRAGR